MHKISLVMLLAAAAAGAACQQEQPERAADTNVAQPAPNRPIVPRPQPPIDRAELLAAVAQAASATASGAQMPESVSTLDGRQFEFRIRFGCRGPATELSDRWLGWSFDSEQRRIRVRAKPTLSIDDPLIAQFSGDEFEAVEGFWIPRPWLLQPVCPAAAAVQSPADGAQSETQEGQRQASGGQRQQQSSRAASTQAAGEDEAGEPVPTTARIGIAQFFTSDDPRTRRRDMRPYEASHTLAEGKAISSQGYNLVLSGRLRALPGRGVINCSARGADSPPECVISAEFLRVWIEQPGTREVIAEWGGG